MLADQKALDALIGGGKGVVIDCTATWCGPCQQIAPQFTKWESENPDLAFAKVDVDEAEELAAALKVEAMPTFIFFKNGQEVSRIQGANKAKIEESIKALKQ
jgi:thioredoxin